MCSKTPPKMGTRDHGSRGSPVSRSHVQKEAV